MEVSPADLEKHKAIVNELTKAQSLILLQAQTEMPDTQQAQELSEWIEEGGSIEQWDAIMHDSITLENYTERLGEFSVHINPLLIGKHQSAYAVISAELDRRKQNVLKTQRKLEQKRELVIALRKKRMEDEKKKQEIAESPGPEAAATAPAAQPEDHPDAISTDASNAMDILGGLPDAQEQTLTPAETEKRLGPEQRKREAKVMVMLLAVLAAIQKQPHKFKEFEGLPQEEIDKAIATRGPELVKKYLKIATRGRMEWSAAEDLWRPHPHDQANLDVKFGLWLLGKAGFNVEVKGDQKNVQMVPPGTEGAADPIVLQFDTMDSAKRLEHELKAKPGDNGMHFEFPEYDDMAEGEYRITIDHHTDDPAERETSGAQLIYEYLSEAGLIEKDPTLEKMVAFVTAHDNGEMPLEGSGKGGYGFYGESADTLWGIANDFKVPRDLVYELLKKYDPADHISPEDLKRSFRYTDRRGTKTGTLAEIVEAKEKQIAHNVRTFGYWQSKGYVVDTKYGPTYVVLDAEGRNMPPQQTARAFGVTNILVWQPSRHAFFLAIGPDEHGNPQQLDIDLPQGDIIRGHLAIYKKQLQKENQTGPLTAELSEMLELLDAHPQRGRSDVFNYAYRDPRGASIQTLYHIYHYPGPDDPTEREAIKTSVIDELQAQEARFINEAEGGNSKYKRLRGKDEKGWISVGLLKEAKGYLRGSRKQRTRMEGRYDEIIKELQDRLDERGPKQIKKTRRGKNGGNGRKNT